MEYEIYCNNMLIAKFKHCQDRDECLDFLQEKYSDCSFTTEIEEKDLWKKNDKVIILEPHPHADCIAEYMRQEETILGQLGLRFKRTDTGEEYERDKV